MKRNTIAAGEFKNSCLRIMESVHTSGVPVLVTKRGKPLVRVVPCREDKAAATLEGAITYEAPDIFSTGETFEAES